MSKLVVFVGPCDTQKHAIMKWLREEIGYKLCSIHRLELPNFDNSTDLSSDDNPTMSRYESQVLINMVKEMFMKEHTHKYVFFHHSWKDVIPYMKALHQMNFVNEEDYSNFNKVIAIFEKNLPQVNIIYFEEDRLPKMMLDSCFTDRVDPTIFGQKCSPKQFLAYHKLIHKEFKLMNQNNYKHESVLSTLKFIKKESQTYTMSKDAEEFFKELKKNGQAKFESLNMII